MCRDAVAERTAVATAAEVMELALASSVTDAAEVDSSSRAPPRRYRPPLDGV